MYVMAKIYNALIRTIMVSTQYYYYLSDVRSTKLDSSALITKSFSIERPTDRLHHLCFLDVDEKTRSVKDGTRRYKDEAA